MSQSVERERYLQGLYVSVPDSEAEVRTLSPVEKTVSELREIGIPVLDELEKQRREEQERHETERIDKMTAEIVEAALKDLEGPAAIDQRAMAIREEVISQAVHIPKSDTDPSKNT